MALFEKWRELTEQERTQEAQEAFWSDYFEKETEAYKKILSEKNDKLSGTAHELAERFSMEDVEIAGFLDGINTSLTEEVQLEELAEESLLDSTIDFEKLYHNMLRAKAPWLYGLTEWDGILSQEKRHEIAKVFRTENIFVAEKTVGRNDPCPCGSGKKYKKCCGAKL